MKRTLFTAAASSIVALAAPGVASAAHHGKHHHGVRHASTHQRHATRARLVRFGAASVSPTPSGSTDTSPATPATTSGETAGTVISLTNGVLTIRLTDGTMVSGEVTENTEIECESATPPPSSTGDDDQGGGADQSGSESGEHGGASTQSQPAGHLADVHQSGGDDQSEGDERQSCTTALGPKAVVREAELSVTSAGAVWEKLDLIQ